MSNIQFGKEGHFNGRTNKSPGLESSSGRSISRIIGVILPQKPADTFWDVALSSGGITAVTPHDPSNISLEHLPSVLQAESQLLAPSLCHPHIHLDKCFLLSDPKYADLEIVKGDFAEAMELTGKAKARFEEEDLLRRGRQLIKESINAGVSAMRAFVEVDEGVDLRCLDAGLKLKREFEGACEVQICAFAQLSVLSRPDAVEKMTELMNAAAVTEGVDVIGSTPYVEGSLEKMRNNIEWSVDMALKYGKHLDFHLDYNLDKGQDPLVWYLIEVLKEKKWVEKATREQKITLGHCTRLTLFSVDEWRKLRRLIGNLPIFFVGLPTSDLFMMGRPDDESQGGGSRVRGTLQIPQMLQKYDINGAIGINNVGNAFTPQGSCDPMSIACLGVGVYQAGTKKDAETIYECISTNARKAIGLEHGSLEFQVGEPADFVLFGSSNKAAGVSGGWRRRKTIQEVVYDACHERRLITGSRLINTV
ncbi:MAG: hypothetical protein M1827_005280 [Pycnora praestabilis]|nr:MAG: hypothetical protein M1827_005280 [Pycnora praestabilis]